MLSFQKKSTEIIIYSLSFILLIFVFQFSSPSILNQDLTKNLDEFEQCKISVNKFENYPEIKKLEIENLYVPISITSEISNIKCIGKVKSFEIQDQVIYIESFQSNRFYNLFQGVINLGFLFTAYLFKFNKKSLFILFLIASTTLFQYIFIFQNSLQLINFFSVISPFLIYFLYFHYLKEQILKDKLFSFSLSVLIYSLFWEYQYFTNLLILFVLIYLKKIYTKNLNQNETTFVMFVPLVFYFLRFVSNLSEYFNSLNRRLSANIYESDLRFLDLQNPLNAINCNVYKFNSSLKFPLPQRYNFSNNIFHSCPYETFYGPIIDNFLRIKISNIYFVGVLITGICFLIIGKFYYNQIKLNNGSSFFLFLLAIGPPTNFLLERMNLDILIFITLYLCLKNYKNNTNITSFFLGLLVFIKYYTVVVFGAILIILWNVKDKVRFLTSGIYFIITLVFFYIFHFQGNNKVLGIDLNSTKSIENTIDYELILGGWMDGLTMSFGNLAHSRNINEVFQLNNLGLIYVSMTLILLGFVYLTYVKNNNLSLVSDDNSHLNFSIITIFIFVGLYSNYDYRLPILILIYRYIFESNDRIFKYSILIFYVTSVSNFLIFGDINSTTDLIFKIVNTGIVLLNLFTFVYIFSFLSATILKHLRKSLENNLFR